MNVRVININSVKPKMGLWSKKDFFLLQNCIFKTQIKVYYISNMKLCKSNAEIIQQWEKTHQEAEQKKGRTAEEIAEES